MDYYLVTAGIVNTFFTVYRAMAVDVFYAMACEVVVLVSAVCQTVLNVTALSLGLAWYIPHPKVGSGKDLRSAARVSGGAVGEKILMQCVH